MQPSHTALNLRSTDILDPLALLVLYKYTRKETDQICAMQQHIRLLKRHAVIDAAG